MKKVYTKPEIVFEDFSPCTGIAANCEIIIDNHGRNSCGYAYEGGGGATMFTYEAGTNVCSLPVDDDETNPFCYHVPLENNNLFNS